MGVVNGRFRPSMAIVPPKQANRWRTPATTMRGLRTVAAAVAATLLLAGCAGDPVSEITEDLAADDASEQNNATAAGELLRFADGNGTNTEVQFEGSFAAQETCTTTCPEHRHDLTPLVPTGYPVRISGLVELTQQTANMGFLQVSVEAEDARTHSSHTSVTESTYEFQRTLTVNSGSVELVITKGGFGDVDYTADVAVDADPTLILPQAPTAMTLQAGTNLTIEKAATGAEADAQIAYVLYDPDDSPLLRLETAEPTVTVAVPPEAPTGEYVLLALPDAAPVRVTADAPPDAFLRVVGVVAEYGPGQSVAAQERVEWEYDVSGPPVAGGAYLTFERHYFHLDPDHLTVTGPDGVAVYEGTLGPTGYTGATLFVSSQWTVLSDRGLPGLVAGTYSFAYEPDETLTGDVGAAVLFLDRS